MANFGRDSNPIQVIGPVAATATTTATTTAAPMTVAPGALYRMMPELDIYWDLYATATAAGSEKAPADVAVTFAVPADKTEVSILASAGTGYVKLTQQGCK